MSANVSLEQKKSPNIKTNFLLNTLYEILCVITPFITAPYLSRVLGAEMIGVNSFVHSIQSYFCMLAALGTVSYGAREIARVRNSDYERSKIFWEIELLSVFTSSIAIVLWIVLIIFSEQYKVYYAVLTLGLFNSMFNISWFYRGIEQFKYTVTRNTLVKIFEIICIFLFVKKEDDLFIFITINAVCSLCGTLSMWLPLKKFLVKVNFRDFHFFAHFKETLIYFVPAIAVSIYTVLDKTLIGLITREENQNGYYEQATKIIKIISTITFDSLTSVLGIRSSYLYAQNKLDEVKNYIKKSTNYLMLMGMGCCFGLIGCANRFVPIFFGSGYDYVIKLLKFITPIVLIKGVSGILGTQYYLPAGKRSKSAKLLIVGSVCNLILNLIFIPKYKSFGAVISSVVAELIIAVLYMKNCDGYLTVKDLISTSWKKLIAGLIMLGYVLTINKMIESNILCLVVQIGGGILIYFSLLLLMKDEFLIDTFLIKIKNYFQKRNKKL